jgi:hypothetical protein
MARQTIVVSGDPKGHFVEGVLTTGATPKPGTCVSLISAGTYSLYTGVDGEQGPIVVLCEDWGQGKTPTSAYADSDRFLGYTPVAGDELQMLFGNATGTGDDVAIGDKLIIDGSTGKVIPTTGSPESEPFVALEAIVDPVADQLILCRYTGH